ncbi:hypothetical protein M0Q50_02440 [bacterium]|jgi:hypothetical protein|nr:hypothetical protein [bacterium]
MTAEEFLIQQWNNCICINDNISKDIYLIYDPIYIRNIKLNSLDNNTNEILPNKQSILFKIDDKYDILYVEHTKIWQKLQYDYNLNYLQTR